jgi:hypothetical protein
MEINKKRSYWEYLEEKYAFFIWSNQDNLKHSLEFMTNIEIIEAKKTIEIYTQIIKDLKIRKGWK